MKFFRQHIWILFLLFLVIDFAQNSYHYSNLPMDGDIPRISAPMIWYQDVLDDPIGITAISENKKYSGAGRYVCHSITKWWFSDVYATVKHFVKDPVHSIYYTSTLLVALLHLCFLFLAYAYAKGREKFKLKFFVIVALLASVLIQLNGYYGSIGIIDRSIDYTLFYALPVFTLLFYLLPFYKYQVNATYKVQGWQHILLIILAPVLAFSGPLIQPVVAILFVLFAFGYFVKNPFYNIKRNYKLHAQFAFLFLCCIYAFYLSQFNSESSLQKLLSERYLLMLKGLYYIFTWRIAWPLLLVGVGLNLLLIYFKKIVPFTKLKPILYFTLFFCLTYILLLPLGGYRVYREFIIRYDTFIPVTLAVSFLLFHTSYLLISRLHDKSFFYYIIGLLVFCAIFFNADINTEKEANYGEQGQLYELMQSKDTVIRKPYVCNVLMWDVRTIYDTENMIAINVMLKRWGILKPHQRVEYYEKNQEEE